MNLNERELATVLAALRYFQSGISVYGAENVKVVNLGGAGHFADVTPLTPDEIDSLCERLNVSLLTGTPSA